MLVRWLHEGRKREVRVGFDEASSFEMGCSSGCGVETRSSRFRFQAQSQAGARATRLTPRDEMRQQWRTTTMIDPLEQRAAASSYHRLALSKTFQALEFGVGAAT